MDRNAFDSLYEHIKTVGKSYYSDAYGTEEAQEKLKQTLDSQLGLLPLDDQAELVSKLREESTKSSPYTIDVTTGYGIIREVYCEHLLDDLIYSAKLKLSKIPSGTFSEESINKKIKEQIKELKTDQFEAFTQAVERYQTPLKLNKTAKERDDYAWQSVNSLMQEVVADRMEEERNFDPSEL